MRRGEWKSRRMLGRSRVGLKKGRKGKREEWKEEKGEN